MEKISTGSADLNKWLGGYDSEVITAVYGPAGVGKTNFCMVATASQVRRGNKAIYVDTEGGFSSERFNQLCEEGLKNVLLLKPTTFEEQEQAFYRLLREIKARSVSLIVVDGMTMLYRLELAEAKNDREKISEINGKLAKQMRMLAEISRKKNIPILVTNQVYSDFLSEEEIRSGKEAGVRMVGGTILQYWSKCIIELQTKGGRRKAILRKHRSLPESEMNFEIIQDGIR